MCVFTLNICVVITEKADIVNQKPQKPQKTARDGAVWLKTANPQKPQKNRKTETANRGAVRFLFLEKPQVRLRFGFSQKPHQTAPCSPLLLDGFL